MTVVAIDFGTSNTIVAIADPITKEPKTLRFAHMSRSFNTVGDVVYVVPTLVYIKGKEEFIIGEQVRAERLGQKVPQRFFSGFKRDLAAAYRAPSRIVDHEPYDTETIAEVFLKTLWQRLALQRIRPTQLVLTVPVGAFDTYLGWVREFAQKLQIPSVQVVDESTAAALGYALTRPQSVVLVIDFGGGTLDMSLVRTLKGDALGQGGTDYTKAEVLAKADAYVGGMDMDIWIAEHWLRHYHLNRSMIAATGWQILLELAEKVKMQLSQQKVAKESWLDDETFTSYELYLDRDELTELLEQHQLLEQFRQTLDELMADAFSKGIAKGDISQVLLVGGSCLLPPIQQLVVSYFGRSKVSLHKPFEAVAHGALALGQMQKLEDHLRHSYAIRVWEPYSKQYTFFTLFEKGTTYPAKRGEPVVLQVAVAGQTEIRLDIGEVADLMQSEVTYDAKGRMTSSELRKHRDFRSLLPSPAAANSGNSQGNHPAAQTVEPCIAHLSPPGQLGIDRVSVWFEISAERMLLATVRDLLTNQDLLKQVAIAQLE
jgi:molecular chaperone DnaK (HSP70)